MRNDNRLRTTSGKVRHLAEQGLDEGPQLLGIGRIEAAGHRRRTGQKSHFNLPLSVEKRAVAIFIKTYHNPRKNHVLAVEKRRLSGGPLARNQEVS